MPKEHDESTDSASPAGISVEQVRRLIQVMDASDVHEVTIERESEGLKLTLRKPTPVVGGAPLVMTSGSNGSQPLAAQLEAEMESAEAEAPATESEAHQKVTATLVGLFRASLKRGSKAAVAVGDAVREEQDVGAIEALNVMNEVKTPVAGRVVEIVVKDGQPVEYGQHLMTIDTGAS
ncbi:MAG TPA: biotin/lipoyl-containing protein [Ktedonobacterales bacterium]|nr:biotin/lipoyl-containing protein [Ktedonobacterales bacterium]